MGSANLRFLRRQPVLVSGSARARHQFTLRDADMELVHRAVRLSTPHAAFAGTHCAYLYGGMARLRWAKR